LREKSDHYGGRFFYAIDGAILEAPPCYGEASPCVLHSSVLYGPV
jgi:hypothetical protein